jgi:hypothetical protein
VIQTSKPSQFKEDTALGSTRKNKKMKHVGYHHGKSKSKQKSKHVHGHDKREHQKNNFMCTAGILN